MEERGQFLNNPVDDDIQKIIIFLDWLQNELFIMSQRYYLLVPEHPMLSQHLVSDWPRIADEFGRAKMHLMEMRPMDKLNEHGLTGAQLNLKLQLVKAISKQNSYAEEIHNQTQLPINPPPIDPNEFTWLDKIRDPFRILERKIKGKLLDISCTILGSLGDAGIPMVGLINEFKEFAGHILEE